MAGLSYTELVTGRPREREEAQRYYDKDVVERNHTHLFKGFEDWYERIWIMRGIGRSYMTWKFGENFDEYNG